MCLGREGVLPGGGNIFVTIFITQYFRIFVPIFITTLNYCIFVSHTFVGDIDFLETQLIFAFCGGVDNDGYVDFSDVHRLLNGRLPERKSKFFLDEALFGHIEIA